MSEKSTYEDLERACYVEKDDAACRILRGMDMAGGNGYAEGGLLADASRTWRMESDYPEFEKGVANRLSKERVPEAEIEEQFNYSPLQRGYAEGGEIDGEIDFDTEGSMLDPEIPLNFEEDYSDRREASDFPAFEEEISAEGEEDILTGLSPEDQEILFQALSDYPELKEILNTLGTTSSPEVFDEEGSVEGPGTGTSDSIPAQLSDGEFVFTAKAVKQLGVDKLRKMMAKAEEDYDEGDVEQAFAQMGDEGFAAGGLLTRADYFSGGGPVSGGVSRKHLGYGGGTYTHGQILKMAKTYGKGFMKNVKRTADGKFRVIGFKYGGEVYEGSSYGENDEGTFTGESTPGTEKNIHYKERERKRLLGDLLYKILGLDPVTLIKGRDGKPAVHRESSLFTAA